MSLFRRGDIWWYESWFANRRVRESAKTPSKTLAKAAEQTRRRALETGFNHLVDAREERVRTICEIAEDYLESYRLRNPAHAHHGLGRERRKRSNHHGYRRACLKTDAEALQPYPNGDEARRARIHRPTAPRESA